MAFQVTWSNAAQDDLRELEEYLHARDPGAAIRVIDRIGAEVESLASFPRRGPRIAGFSESEDRYLTSGNYKIGYCVDAPQQSIEVTAVWHTSRETPPPR